MKRLLVGVLVLLSVLLGAYIVGFFVLLRSPTLDDLVKANVFGSLYKLFLSSLAVFGVYQVGKFFGKEYSSSPLSVYLCTVGMAFLLAWLLPSQSGASYSDCDPRFGGNCEVTDVPDEPEQTTHERLSESMLIFFGVSIPGLIGVRKGFKEAPELAVTTKSSVDN